MTSSCSVSSVAQLEEGLASLGNEAFCADELAEIDGHTLPQLTYLTDQ